MDFSRRVVVRRPDPPPGSSRWRSAGLLALLLLAPSGVAAQTCARTLTADVVALDVSIWYNRMGAHDPNAMIYALKRDVIAADGSTTLSPGNVQLRSGKRPRPLVLRANVGDCIQIHFTNLLGTAPKPTQPHTRAASLHVMGMHLVTGITDDGSNVGANPSSQVEPGETRTYTLQGQKEGVYMIYSPAVPSGGNADGGQISRGLFGAFVVEPKNSEWYRSQLTNSDMTLATARDASGNKLSTPAGHPVIDYDARYPAGHPRAGLPILKMLDGSEVVHADLNAIITGPNKGRFPDGTYTAVSSSGDRHEPFREFTVVFHDEIEINQAFPQVFEDPLYEFTLHSGRDGFAINYGSSGVGAEVLSNRFGVGPAGDCTDCKFEEAFLSSWAYGDPAMVVDVPADFDGNADGLPDPGKKATKVFYADDPSNVSHSYLNDRVKIRNLHVGPEEHHVFHLHAHQWLHTPDSDSSAYLDSQTVGPGSGYTYELSYGGGGNRNATPGDAIYHCHFYPHFAQGMWALWRIHDVMERGTELDADGRPAPGSRALPDGEIVAGTPIPAVVPIPGKDLPPMPSESFAGYPFYIPGVAGHRAPRPPLDVARDADNKPIDGGLARHVVKGGTADFPQLNTRDFSKRSLTLVADQLPEEGTAKEQQAMLFHEQPSHATYKVDPVTFGVSSGSFRTNGKPRAPGAPFADPCIAYSGEAMQLRTYRAAAFQMDVKYNKAGWHNPQHRMFALWEDVGPTRNGTRAPEPMFIRANTYDCIEYRLVNLIPMEYKMDDFQVRTPTDVLGQHIHLVKFDVTSSDGGANGFNYEDGSLAPGEVRERIHAIRKQNGCVGTDSGDSRDGTFACPVARAHPYFGSGENGQWIGAQETIQRWYMDNLLNKSGEDRTLRTIFTHDHFSPSTHQQNGLYAGLLSEPAGSRWRDPETGVFFGEGRFDGGPTSWRADILTPDPSASYREFALQIADFSLAYDAQATTIPNPQFAINPPGRFLVGLPDLVRPPFAKNQCPNLEAPPCPELVSADDPGTMLVNYRNEPLALRVRDPSTNTQAAGEAGDLAHAFRSDVLRADSRLNTQPSFYPARPGVLAGDPFTPLMRGLEGDKVQIRMLVGAHEEVHNTSLHGPVWYFEPSEPNSGYKNSQTMALSEHFEFRLPPLPKNNKGPDEDFLYKAGGSVDDLWNGTWGLMRVSKRGNSGLLQLPNNTGGDFIAKGIGNYNGICPKSAPVRTFSVTAALARDILPGGALVFNSRAANGGPLSDPNAILYVRSEDLGTDGKLKAGVPVEPLILRVAAGDCIEVTLNNNLPATGPPEADGFNQLPMIVDEFNANDIRPSSHVGLHPQLVAYDVTRSDGTNVGSNPIQTAAPGHFAKYQWYAGITALAAGTDSLTSTPIEFGATNLMPADPIEHSSKGAIGALIVEPRGATWTEDTGSRAQATVKVGLRGPTFREFVMLIQDDLNLRRGDGQLVPRADEVEDSEDSGQKALNYRTEPHWLRMGFPADMPLHDKLSLNFRDVLSNAQVGGADPQTPVFTAKAGTPVRFRVLQPGGHARNYGIHIHGHSWQELPYVSRSTAIGSNQLSEVKGSQEGIGPTSHTNFVIPSAGGPFKVTGDYLIRVQNSFAFTGGLWAILRVVP